MSRLLKLLFLKGVTPKIMEISKYLGRKFGVHVLKNTWCINLCPQCNICWVKTFFFFYLQYFEAKFKCPPAASHNDTLHCRGFDRDYLNFFGVAAMLPIVIMGAVNIWLQSKWEISLSLSLPPSPSLSRTLLSCDSLFAILILLLAIHWTQ